MADLAKASAGNWVSLQLGPTLNPLQAATSAVKTITSNMTTALQTQVTILKTVAALVSDLLDLEALAIKTAISIVEAVLDKYVDLNAKVHLLVVPIRKQPIFKLSSLFSMPQLDDSNYMSGSIADEDRKAFQKAVSQIATATEGNESFGRTVIESLEDLDDPFKPDYGDNDAVFAVVILAGAKNIVNILAILQSLQAIFSGSLKGNTMVPSTITMAPQDLTASAIPSTSALTTSKDNKRIATLLQWTNPPALQSLADFDGGSMKIKEFAIIRSTSDEAILAQDWTAFFTDQPTELTSEDGDKTDVMTSANGLTKIILQGKFFLARNVWVDRDSTLVKGKDYYYTVAFRYAIAAPPDIKGKAYYTTQDYFRISNVVKVRFTDNIPSKRGGIAPDWISHESVLDLIPYLRFYFNLIKAYLAALKSTTTGAKTALDSYIKFLEAEIVRYTAFYQDVTDRITNLSNLFKLPTTGVYVTTIVSETGGNDAFVKELVTRLTDTTDESAPPYFQNGYTAGLVILAGANNPADLSDVKSLISLLFGLSNEAQTAYEKAVDEIDAVIEEAESARLSFDDTLSESALAEAASDDRAVGNTFDDAMNPVNPLDPTASIPFHS